MLSNKEFKKIYHMTTKPFANKFHKKAVQNLLDKEFKQLSDDRELFREIFLTLEKHSPNEYILSNTCQMPVNVFRIIEDAVYNNQDILNNMGENKNLKLLDPVYCINKVNDLCDNIVYTFRNSIQETKKAPIPEYLNVSLTLLRILLRSHLCTSYLVRKKVNNYLLDIIIKRVRLTFKQSLIAYGTAIGILAAQSASEPLMQFVLDARHRTGGGGGTKTNGIIRIQEILNAKDTEKMKHPFMTIMVKEQYEHDKLKVQEIANHIEMMKFSRFITSSRVFFETYGKPVHPKFKHEEKAIKKFEKYNIGQGLPSNLSSWCIRYELDKEELVLKSMKLETIILELKLHYPKIHFVYTPENADKIFIRCYIQNTQFKNLIDFKISNLIDLSEEIENVIIRGVKGILSTNIVKVIKGQVDKEGALSVGHVWAIQTDGTNLVDIITNEYVDPYRIQSDSILEMERVFGITAARNKICNELIYILKSISRMHCTIFADEMVYSGQVTNIKQAGLQIREMSNVHLRLSFVSPIQVIENAATDGLVDTISGISAELIIGSTPKIGTAYNQVQVNKDFVESNSKSIEEELDDL